MIPNGKYHGIWDEFVVRFVVDEEHYEATTKYRNEPATACEIRVIGQTITVRTRGQFSPASECRKVETWQEKHRKRIESYDRGFGCSTPEHVVDETRIRERAKEVRRQRELEFRAARGETRQPFVPRVRSLGR